jgi:hypothetical protein
MTMAMTMRFWKTKGTNNKSVHTYTHRTNKHGKKEHFGGEKMWDAFQAELVSIHSAIWKQAINHHLCITSPLYMHIAFAD